MTNEIFHTKKKIYWIINFALDIVATDGAIIVFLLLSINYRTGSIFFVRHINLKLHLALSKERIVTIKCFKEKQMKKKKVYRMTPFSLKAMERRIKMYFFCSFNVYSQKSIYCWVVYKNVSVYLPLKLTFHSFWLPKALHVRFK